MTKPNVYLQLEGFPGAAVKDIGTDMQAVSDRLDLPVALNMNGARLLTCDPEGLRNAASYRG